MEKKWYESKTIQGVIITVLGFGATQLNIPILDGEITQVVTSLLTLVGVGYTVYGRYATRGERLTK